MAKVHYVQGRYRDAQGMCARVGLEELTQDDQPVYHFRLLAESFIIKGTWQLWKIKGYFQSFFFVISNKNIVLTKWIAEICKHGHKNLFQVSSTFF